jgi:mono/diheme cytochrome c family protein
MVIRVITGTIAVVLTLALLTWTALNEDRRMAEFEAGQAGRSVESGALLFQSNCRPCHGNQGEGIPGVGPALNNPDLFNGNRTRQVGFAGTVRDFVELTIAAGRPLPSVEGATYPQRMPTWSQRYGGPLRDDQIADLTNFVMNWDQGAESPAQTPVAPPVGTPVGTPQAGGTPGTGVGGTAQPGTAQPPGGAGFEPVGTDLNVTLPAGDATRGNALFNGSAPLADGQQAGCQACHGTGTGPDLAGVGTRAATRKPGLSADQYLHESIMQPSALVVDGFADIMPKNFGQRMSAQNLADIIAYLLTLR